MMLIEMENINFAYNDVTVLEGVSLTIEKGEAVVLTGPNGCGKSTILKLMNGLIFPNSGRYCFDGIAITTKTMEDNQFAKAFHQRMGYVFQNTEAMLFCGSVYDEVAFGPRQMGLSESIVQQRVTDCLDLMGLASLADRAPYHLSGGEKKKTVIASVLSMNPEILVMDEPTNDLDLKTQAWLCDFLTKMKVAGKTIILASHDRYLIDAAADRQIELG